jgi:hypothetical protein
MPLFQISRPSDQNIAETIGTSSGIRGALVNAADPAAARVAANALGLARGYNNVFTSTSWVITDIATTPGGLFVNTLVDGDFSTVRGVWQGK